MPTTNLVTENFESATLGVTPSGFTGGIVVSSGGGKALGLATSSNGQVTAINATLIPTPPVDQVLVFTSIAANGEIQSPMLRYDSATDAKIILLSGPGSCTVYMKPSGGTQVAHPSGPQSVAASFSNGDVVHCKAEVIGTTLRMKVWLNGSTEPIGWDFTLTVTVTTAGRPAWYSQGGNSQTIDNIVYDSLDDESGPSASLEVSPSTAVAVSGGSAIPITATRTGGTGALSATRSPAVGTLSTATPTSGTPFTWLPPGSGSGTVRVTVTDADDGVSDYIDITYAPAGVTIPVTNSKIYYVGNRWVIHDGIAECIAVGSQLRFRFSGDSCTVRFSIAGLDSYPRVRFDVDGVLYPTVQLAADLSSVALTIVLDSTTSPQRIPHTVTMFFDGMKQAQSWINHDGSLRFAGLTLAAGGAMLDPLPALPLIEFVGDSTVQTVRYGKGSESDPELDAADMNGTFGWPARTARAIGYDASIHGYGATDVIDATGGNATGSQGSGGVPNTVTNYDLNWNGQSTVFAVHPRVIVNYIGTNTRLGDPAAYRVGYRALLTKERANHPNAIIFNVVPDLAATLLSAIQLATADKNDEKMIVLDYTDGKAYNRTTGCGDNVHLGPGASDDMTAKLSKDILDNLANFSSGDGVYPTEDQVLDGIVFGSSSQFIGNFVNPGVSHVEKDFPFGPDSSLIGTLEAGGVTDLETIKAACIEALQETRVKLDFSDTAVIPNVSTNTLAGSLNGNLITAFGDVIWNRTLGVLSIFRKGNNQATAEFDVNDPDKRIAS